MLRPVLLLQVALSLLAAVHAAPVHLSARQQLQGAAQVQTTQTTQTVQGLMTQTCTVTLTPITDVNGNPAVQEVQTCTVAMANGSGQNANPSAPTTGDTTGGSTSSSGTSNTSSSSSAPPSGGGGGLAGSVNGVSSIAASDINTLSLDSGTATGAAASATSSVSTSATVTSAITSATPAAGIVNGVSSVSVLPTADPAVNAAATAAASNASAAPAQAFTLPGKKLSVLPIGLGVFAGISVIALIVVGLVTYERTKYRKAFRQRKLAEAGSAMGYGGMAQRT